MVDLGPSRANSWCCDPVFCVHCGRVGHSVQNCQVKRDMLWSGQDQEEQFGEWMRASSLQMLGLEPTQPMDPIQNKLPSRLPIPQQTPVLQDVQKNQVSSPAILSFTEQQLPKDTCAATTSHNHLSISPTELTSTQSSHNQESSSPLGSPVGLNFPSPSKLHPCSLSSDPTPVPVIQPTTRPNLHNVVNPGPKQHTSAAPDNHPDSKFPLSDQPIQGESPPVTTKQMCAEDQALIIFTM